MTETPRERIAYLARAAGFGDGTAVADDILRVHAHELAEQQRHWAYNWPGETEVSVHTAAKARRAICEAADLIDPEVERASSPETIA